MGWIIFLLIVIAVCATICICTYMYLCSENECGFFEDYSRSGRMRDVEIAINKLEDEINILKSKLEDK